MAVTVPAELVERDPAVLAPRAGLTHLTDAEPGFSRRRRGSGFSYSDARGRPVSAAHRARLEGLAVPPAWNEVWLCPRADGYLQASGYDDAGRKQYLYHPDYRALCDSLKFARLAYFPPALRLLREASAAGLDAPVGSRSHAVSAALRLIDTCLLRVGNEGSAANGHYGATTLTVDHVQRDNGVLTLEYVGKSGKPQKVVVEDDDFADVLTTLAGTAHDELFWFTDEQTGDRRRADANDINRFIGEHAGPAFTAKDFRTWGGSRVALEARASGAEVLEAVDAAADELGNTRAVVRSSYVHPRVLEAPKKTVDRVWQSSRTSRWADRGDSALAKLLDPERRRSGRRPSR